MKRIIVLITILLCLCGCGSQNDLSNSDQIDLDLTVLNDSLAYAQLVNIIKEPDDYLGKTIRLKGAHSKLFNGYSGEYYHECTIQDLTLCCAQGIEFVLNDKNYPDEGDIIVLSGVLDLFEEGKHSYCYIKNAAYIAEDE